MIRPDVSVPRVILPGVTLDPEIRKALDAAQDHEEFLRDQQRRMAEAMIRLGKPIFRRGKPKPKRSTRHVQHKARVKARVETLRLDRAMTEYAASTTPGGTWIEEEAA